MSALFLHLLSGAVVYLDAQVHQVADTTNGLRSLVGSVSNEKKERSEV